MAKFSDLIGFVVNAEATPGVWKDTVTEVYYSGDILRDTRQWNQADKVNDNMSVSNRISIVGNPFAFSNVAAMRYVKYLGACWRISNIEVQHPRLIISLGGLYDGIKA
jgi:hypothetical protein